MSDVLSGATIAFDLDGTLADTAPDLHTALNKMMAEQNLPPAALEDVRRYVGHGARRLIVRAMAVHGRRPQPAELDQLTEAYVRYYAEDISSGSRPWPGVEETLRALSVRGAKLAVCTNKRTGLSKQLLVALGLSRWFTAVVGADSVALPKPHPEHFLAAVRAAGGDPRRAMMVGDSAADVGAAKAAGAPVALVAFGYTDTAPELLGADAVFNHFDELPGLAETLLQNSTSQPGYT